MELETAAPIAAPAIMPPAIAAPLLRATAGAQLPNPNPRARTTDAAVENKRNAIDNPPVAFGVTASLRPNLLLLLSRVPSRRGVSDHLVVAAIRRHHGDLLPELVRQRAAGGLLGKGDEHLLRKKRLV